MISDETLKQMCIEQNMTPQEMITKLTIDRQPFDMPIPIGLVKALYQYNQRLEKKKYGYCNKMAKRKSRSKPKKEKPKNEIQLSLFPEYEVAK